jgi:hypothetical protein
MSLLQGNTANHRNRNVHAAVLYEGLAVHLQIYTGIFHQICRANIVIPLEHAAEIPSPWQRLLLRLRSSMYVTVCLLVLDLI